MQADAALVTLAALVATDRPVQLEAALIVAVLRCPVGQDGLFDGSRILRETLGVFQFLAVRAQ